MNQLERGLLLLCSDLGDETIRPLSFAQYRALRKKVRDMGIGNSNPDKAVEPSDLVRLGYDQPAAEWIVRLLDRDAQLDRYLQRAAAYGIVPVTQWSPDYPVRMLQNLGDLCPPVLFCFGDCTLLRQPGVSLVGSRKLLPSGRQFASRVGQLAAQESLTLISGGAVGADSTAQNTCLQAGGTVLSFLAESLLQHAAHPIPDGMLLCSETGFTLPFSPQRAISRNRLIHAMGLRTFVAQTSAGTGGTFRGTVENLSHGWSPVFVHADGSEGARLLCLRGAIPVPLHRLQTLRGAYAGQPALPASYAL